MQTMSDVANPDGPRKEQATELRDPSTPPPSLHAHAGWNAYDEISETYALVAAPYYFERAGEDLVALLETREGHRFLDAGAGTGAVSKAAHRAVGARGRVIAVDASIPMLRTWNSGAAQFAAELPRLPLRAERFDRAAAAFVLSHLSDPDQGFAAVAETVRRGGKVGVSAWQRSPGASEPSACWSEIAAEFIDSARVDAAVARVLPFETRFASAESLSDLLHAAGLRDVAVTEKSYGVEIPVASFIESRLISMASRFMAAELPRPEWARFSIIAEKALRERFGDRLSFSIRVNFAVGTK